MKNIIFLNQVWALVPARSGSKSIKNKNLKKIGKYSLVARAIIVAKKCKMINRVFVSTDSLKIKNEAIKYKAEVPFLRSKKNSGDKSNDYDVVKEFLFRTLEIKKKVPKYILYLRPTTPFRSLSVINKAILKIKKLQNYHSLVSVNKMSEPVHKKFFIRKKMLQPIFSNLTIDKANGPRQNFPNSYSANGYLDIINSKNIFKYRKYLNKKCYPYIVPETIDIDTSFELTLARNYLKKKNV